MGETPPYTTLGTKAFIWAGRNPRPFRALCAQSCAKSKLFLLGLQQHPPESYVKIPCHRHYRRVPRKICWELDTHKVLASELLKKGNLTSTVYQASLGRRMASIFLSIIYSSPSIGL